MDMITDLGSGSELQTGGVSPTTAVPAPEVSPLVRQAVSVASTICVVSGVLSIACNLICLAAITFIKDSNLPYKSYLLNLAISDILCVCAFFFNQYSAYGLLGHISPGDQFSTELALPYVFRSLPWVFFTAYLLTLTTLGINQYIAVCQPWRYATIFSQAKARLILAATWILASFQIIVPTAVLISLHDSTDPISILFRIAKIEMQFWMAIYIVNALGCISMSVTVYRKINHLKRACRRLRVNPANHDLMMKQQAFITNFLLLLATITLRLPLPITSIISLEFADHSTNTAGILTFVVVHTLLYLNFLIHPLIYIIRLVEIRRVYRAWLMKAVTTVTSMYHSCMHRGSNSSLEEDLALQARRPLTDRHS